MSATNKLVLIGNGFDLAHGLKTSYTNFLDWYMCEAFEEYCKSEKSIFPFNLYSDLLIEMKRGYSPIYNDPGTKIITAEQVVDIFLSDEAYSLKHEKKKEQALNVITENNFQSLNVKSTFFLHLLNRSKERNWVDIEREYFEILKICFSNTNLNYPITYVSMLNEEFIFIINKLSEYIQVVNREIAKTPKLDIYNTGDNIQRAFPNSLINSNIKYLNFNYTETLCAKGYADEKDVIHIHGRAAGAKNNPIIFGYGDETDSAYQAMEDSGENMYLEHIKSFGYFKTNNYANLISYIDSAPYTVYIVGHSCGLSDRILLNEIFEHANCEKIEIFYYRRPDGTDNFTEITQEISRHFKPQNKGMMRRKIATKSDRNIIPQN